MAEVVHLTVEAVKAIHAKVLARHGGLDGLRDEGLLWSAVSATQATWDGKPLFAEPREVAAAYLFYICRNHPFNDGNKRTALAACLVVLEANGLLPDAARTMRDVDAWEAFVLDVASGKIDRDETAKRLRGLLGGKRS
jgi:death on curing protein